MRYFGEIGFAETRETSPGIWQEVITNAVISIVGDTYAFDHLFAIRWCQWAGALWTVAYADFKRPRIVLTLGELYNVQNGG